MKICFWGKLANALSGSTGGGGELQIALIAKTLVGLGHEVVVVDLDITEEFVTKEGIKVCPVIGYHKGIRTIRALTRRLPGLYSTFVKINADIYYCRIRDSRHILVYMAARKVKAKFVLALASDLDILTIRKRWEHFYSSGHKKLWDFFNGFVSELDYPYLLKHADLVMVQHQGQKELMQKKGIHSQIFHNLIADISVSDIENVKTPYFIYIGSLDKRKGFEDFYKLAERTPGNFYKVVGRIRDKTASLIYEELKSFKNVSLVGQLNHQDAIREIAESKALISTSPMEGFPNIFLEAWASGVPVISLHVDPGGVINREGLGFVADGNLDKLIEMMNSVKISENFAEKSRSYIRNTHELNSAKINEINSIFTDIYNGNTK